MTEKNTTPCNKPSLSPKRTEDVSVEELKNLPIFIGRTDEELQAIIEAAKLFTKTVFDIYIKEQHTRKPKTQNLILKTQNKAA